MVGIWKGFAAWDSFGRYVVKSARFDRLLASTALALVLALSSHAGMAQQTEKAIQASVPMPDTTLPPPLTAKDIEAKPGQPAPSAPKQDAAPAAEGAKAAAPPAAAPTATAKSGVADKVREIVASRQFERLVTHKSDRAGIEAFYSGRNYAPLWLSNNAGNERAKTAIAYLAQADAVVPDPSDYPTPDLRSAASPDAMAEAELKLTASALTFARQAQIGRIHYTRVGADIQYDLVAPEPASVLAKLAETDDAGSVLDSFNPPQAGFKALRAKLAELRGASAPESKTEDKPERPRVHVPEGKILRVGMKDARVVAVRKRLDIAGDKDNPLYDDAVRDAVKTFQTESDIGVDGNLGPNTVRALNGERKEARRPAA